jgi:adenylate kinase family enzyme
MIIFFTGACGAGKTTLTNHLQETLPPEEFEFFHTDDTPLPSNEEVERLYVDGWQGWQKVYTRKWIDMLLPRNDDKTIIWDGQTNIDFLSLYLSDYRSDDYRIVLVECEEKEMMRRLIEDRNQPELACEDQANWRNQLHRQAKEKGLFILDSTEQTTSELAHILFTEVIS